MAVVPRVVTGTEHTDGCMLCGLLIGTYILKLDCTGTVEITNRPAEGLRRGKFQLVCLNFVNLDMAGHTDIWRLRSRRLIKLFVLR